MENLVLVPGSNIVPISADISAGRTISYLSRPQYCKDGVLPFKLLGENVTNHGETLSYFQTALASVNQTVEMKVGAMIEESFGTKVKCASD